LSHVSNIPAEKIACTLAQLGELHAEITEYIQGRDEIRSEHCNFEHDEK
jgi:uncharacterized coiled-coil DUF342 family protein